MSNLALHNHHLYANSYMQGYVMRKQHHVDDKQVLVSGANATGPKNLKVVNKMRQPLPQSMLSSQLRKITIDYVFQFIVFRCAKLHGSAVFDEEL